MKRDTQDMIADVEKLAQASVEAQAAEKVWQKFEAALESLSPESRAVLSEYFSGHSPKQISQAMGLDEAKVLRWIEQGKRQLIHELRNKSSVRQ